jgi:hypothetical protein
MPPPKVSGPGGVEPQHRIDPPDAARQVSRRLTFGPTCAIMREEVNWNGHWNGHFSRNSRSA